MASPGATDSKEDTSSLAEGFQSNILELIDLFAEMSQKIEEKGGSPTCGKSLFNVAKMYIQSRDKHVLITEFIHKSNEEWKNFETKDEKMLFNNVKSLFPVIPDDKVTLIAEMLHAKTPDGKEIVEKKDREDIWDYVKEFIRIAITYIHHQRCWGKRPNDTVGYTVTYFKDISVKVYAEMFKVRINKG